MSRDLDILRDWLQFFRDIGVDDLSLPGATAGAPAASGSSADGGLAAIREDLGDCRRCKLHSGRRTIVFGAGPENADLVFVGEAPGETEDIEGLPFVGRAGELLTKMIAAMGYARGDVYIANVVKCRPPGNRDPQPDEIAACRPFLERQLEALHPRVIVALGAFAAQVLTGSAGPITQLRGHLDQFRGIPVMPTYHPAYLLYSPSKKKEAWEDLRKVMKLLGKPLPPTPSRNS